MRNHTAIAAVVAIAGAGRRDLAATHGRARRPAVAEVAEVVVGR